MPRRAVPIVEQVPGAVCRVVLACCIIADGVGNIRMAARRRPPLQDLRIAGMVVGIDQENLGRFILLGFAAVRRIIAEGLTSAARRK